MFKITEDNYEHYKKIAEVIWGFQFKNYPLEISEDNLPINVLSKWEQKNKSIARKVLKAGLNDSLIMLKDAPKEYLQQLNEQLIKSGLSNLNKLGALVGLIPTKIFKRGKIKNLDEYYIIKEIIDDVSSDISQEERKQLNRLFREFEIDFKNKK